MTIPQSFLDELRARTTLSALIGSAVKLTKGGREHKGCCPFHDEKTPSFTVNDEKGFYHCFGCQAHGDAIRWLTDARGLAFIDAVKELADKAGMEVPAPTPEAKARAERIDGVRPALVAAQGLFVRSLEANGAAREYLLARSVDDAAITRFGLGWAPRDYVRQLGIAGETALDAGLIWQDEKDHSRWGETFRSRITIPIHDARGRLTGFAARAIDGAEPKYKNSPDSEIFDKGATLFNLHRAAEAARKAKRLIVVEGQLDALAVDSTGIAEVVAPMGTALTDRQLELAWRLVDCPVLAFDGDAAGRKAAVRACTAALPFVGPQRTLKVAIFPAGQDPDEVARAGGSAAIEAVLGEADALARFLFDAMAADCPGDEPEQVAGVWDRLDALARTIRDEETRGQYLASWRARFEREVSLAVPGAEPPPALHALIAAEDGDYAWPEDQNESERRLIMIVQRLLELRRDKAALTESCKDLLSVAKAIGFSPRAINAAVRDIEADAGVREDQEALHALYRRVLGVKGPMTEAMMPTPADARTPKVISAMERRLSKTMAMIEARDVVLEVAADG